MRRRLIAFVGFCVCYITGNCVSILDSHKKAVLKHILNQETKSKNSTYPYFVFALSEVLESMPSRIPSRFDCYQKALTARFILKLLSIENTLKIGFNPDADRDEDKFHAWVETDVCAVCGYAISSKYKVLKAYH